MNQSFGSMLNLIKNEKPQYNTLQGYCRALYKLTRDTTVKDVEWLVNGGEVKFKEMLTFDFGGTSEYIG